MKISWKKIKHFIQQLFEKEIEFDQIILPQGEKIKSFKYLELLIDKILKLKVDRDTLLICVGGGVLGDLVRVGFISYSKRFRFCSSSFNPPRSS